MSGYKIKLFIFSFWSTVDDNFRKHHSESTSKTSKLMWESFEENQRREIGKKISDWHKTDAALIRNKHIAESNNLKLSIDGIIYESSCNSFKHKSK